MNFLVRTPRLVQRSIISARLGYFLEIRCPIGIRKGRIISVLRETPQAATTCDSAFCLRAWLPLPDARYLLLSKSLTRSHGLCYSRAAKGPYYRKISSTLFFALFSLVGPSAD